MPLTPPADEVDATPLLAASLELTASVEDAADCLESAEAASPCLAPLEHLASVAQRVGAGAPRGLAALPRRIVRLEQSPPPAESAPAAPPVLAPAPPARPAPQPRRIARERAAEAAAAELLRLEQRAADALVEKPPCDK